MIINNKNGNIYDNKNINNNFKDNFMTMIIN
jgi:hypothetical protein